MSAIRAVLAVIIVFLAGIDVHYGWSAETNVPFGALLFCIALIIVATADEV